MKNTSFKGYDAHVVSTLSEWLMVGAFQLFILTFAIEFRHLNIAPMQVLIPSAQQSDDNADVRVTYRHSLQHIHSTTMPFLTETTPSCRSNKYPATRNATAMHTMSSLEKKE